MTVFREGIRGGIGAAHLKALAPTVYEVLQGDPNILIDDFAVAFRGIVVSENVHGTNDLYTGVVRGHNDDALLPVLVRVLWVALTEH